MVVPNYASRIARVAIAVLLLAAITAFVHIDAVVASARDASPLWIAGAVALLPLNLFLEAAKWRLLLRTSFRDVKFGASLRSLLAGYALGIVTPARIGDYAGRVLHLESLDKGRLLALAVLDRLYSVWIYTAAGTVLLGFQLAAPLPGPHGAWWLTFGVGAALSVVIGVFIARPRSLYPVFAGSLRRFGGPRLRRHLISMSAIPGRVSSGVLLLSAARYGIFCTQFVLLVLAFSNGSPVTAVYAGVALTFFAKTIIPSITFLDLGIREGAAVFFLGFFGVAAASALNASLILFVINLVVPALAGISPASRLNWIRRNADVATPRMVEASTG